jgi:DDE superfamily endonuclease
MEDVLDLYQQPPNPLKPVVCMDELCKELHSEVREPLAARPGKIKRIDSEYRRHGTANVFLFTEPLKGWRRAFVTAQRTRIDWAKAVKVVLDEVYPDAQVVRLVMDNLNVHSLGSLYQAFDPAEARRLAKRLEIHYTPKHGSWLNIAEIEFRALAGQCLDRRIPDRATLEREVAAWEADRNTHTRGVDWQFTTEDARVKLKRLYPVFTQT